MRTKNDNGNTDRNDDHMMKVMMAMMLMMKRWSLMKRVLVNCVLC